MAAHTFLRKAHRVVAALFLVAVPPAAWASFTAGDSAPSPLVYLPLPPLAILVLTGTYLLVRPWVLRLRGRGHPGEA